MSTRLLRHYYGDQVRVLFVIAGLIMIISYPYFSPLIGVQAPVAVLGFALFAVFGGFMNPEQKWVIILNSVISVVAFIIFEYAAVYTYNNWPTTVSFYVAFFWVNQILALIFFFAAYLSTKTLRGRILESKK